MGKILIGLTGSVSLYKMPSVIRRLRENGHSTKAVMTLSARKMMGESIFAAVTGSRVYTDTFESYDGFTIPHIDLGKWADVILISPASADFISKLAQGFGDDLLSATVLARGNKLAAIAPAMNVNMWTNAIIQKNAESLRNCEFHFIGPDSGSLACNDTGKGRLADESAIIAECERIMSKGILKGKSILVTAGPTFENIDPVRAITNLSSGKTGTAIAQEAFKQKAECIHFVSPPQIAAPHGCLHHPSLSSKDFLESVSELLPKCDILVMSAAISDYRPSYYSKDKLKRKQEKLILQLEPTEDILLKTAEFRKNVFTVGFALETGDIIQNAQKKIQSKKIDLIIANSENTIGSMFSDATFIDRDGSVIESFEKISKEHLAEKIILYASKAAN
ncbi:bifunctional phosphopantothenoylcysteine decarboxylase/phosphopantothenate--cysteine ligase CoaBC [candidate division WOR-3 bacterium]|nr:bifunctional phosphopantothenoylcysteine decarboxylase/phosphopantothenate--cysteine ligase CoaBC [candidate division WOR-3 bacterium]